jgi:hypothetical protein
VAVLRHAEEVGSNAATTCRYCGISRPTIPMWLNRYRELGADGLVDRSRRLNVSRQRHGASRAFEHGPRPADGTRGLVDWRGTVQRTYLMSRRISATVSSVVALSLEPK